MEVKKALLKRRSCRKFKEDKICEELINELLSAAMSGPSARNMKPWKFYVIEDKNKLDELKTAGPGFGYSSPLNIVVCGDTTKGLTNKVEDFWIQDCSSAIENILLMATSLDLGTCWCGIFPVDERVSRVKEILNMSENLIPLGLIHIGYPDCQLDERTQYEESNVIRIKE